MRKSITKVTAETQDSVTTTLNDGDRVIIWGDSSQLKLKSRKSTRTSPLARLALPGNIRLMFPHPRSPSSSDGDFVGFVGSGAMFAAGDLRE
jgi:hypothetical protein